MNMDTTFKTALFSAENGVKDAAKIDPKAEEAASEFEALLIRKVVSSMQKMIPEGGMGMSGKQMHDYLVEESLTQAIKDGGGMGMQRLFDQNMAPQSPKTRGLLPSIPGVIGQASMANESPAEATQSLGELMPPVNDPWLEGPDAEQELLRLMMGPNHNEDHFGQDGRNQVMDISQDDPLISETQIGRKTLTGILRGGE